MNCSSVGITVPPFCNPYEGLLVEGGTSQPYALILKAHHELENLGVLTMNKLP